MSGATPGRDENGLPQGGCVVSAAAFNRLMLVRTNQDHAREAKAEREERRVFREMAKEQMRQRGAMLKGLCKEQQQANATTIEAMQSKALERGRVRRAQREVEKVTRAEHQRVYEEKGHELIHHEREQEERKRAAIAHVQQVHREETAAMRKELKALKQEVDGTIIADKRAAVARVRADTAHDKIRRAKSAFVNARWDKADNLRQDIERWRMQRRDQELAYLAGAVEINESLDFRNVERARRRAREEAGEAAAEVRRQREDLRVRQQENQEIEEGHRKLVVESMQGPKIEIGNDTHGESLVQLFSRLFGFTNRGNRGSGDHSPVRI
jgi:hypothetical protein